MVYINLDDRTDRREMVEKEFERVGLSPERVSGTKINATNVSQIDGALGCAMSHLRVLYMAKERKSNIFIFEDDVMFINNYEEIIENATGELTNLDYNMFYLGANILKQHHQITDHLSKLTHAQATHAYGVKFEFIDTLMATILLRLTNGQYVIPIDKIYAEIVVPHNNCYIVAPKMAAVQRDSFSDIEGTNSNYESYLEKRYYGNFVPSNQKE
jgi:GR25 family glycosyltransferase involved in LPS biosynthesis